MVNQYCRLWLNRETPILAKAIFVNVKDKKWLYTIHIWIILARSFIKFKHFEICSRRSRSH